MSRYNHADPCCHKWGCVCRLDADGNCRVCRTKLENETKKPIVEAVATTPDEP